MEDFLKYLKNAKETINSNTNLNHIHIILGNESVDLDSTISVLLLAYLISKNKLPRLPQKYAAIPVINTSYEHFLIRTENCYVLKEAGVNLDDLVFRESLDADNLIKKNITTSLVDHHVLSEKDKILKETVIQIIDHRPVDSSCSWNEKEVEVRIIAVGSCATLVADEIINTNATILVKEIAFLLYQTIVFDTVALLPENGRAKEQDIRIAEKLEAIFGFDISRKQLFEKLWDIHNDISNLTAKQLLYKDLKVVEHVFVPGLPMLVNDYFKLKDSYIAVKQFASDHKCGTIVLVGLDAREQVQRDVGIFSAARNIILKDILVQKLKNSQTLKGYNFELNEVPSEYSELVLFKQANIKLSRKQIIPLVKDSVTEYSKIK